MDKKDFMAQYRSKWWMETSKRIKARDHNTCQMCGCNDKPLSVHHLYYGEDGNIHIPDDCLITLCEDCHLEQQDYKDLCRQSLEELRFELTDFEIYNLLEAIKTKYTSLTGYPIWTRSVNPKIAPRPFILNEDMNKIENLSIWRSGILKKKLARQAIHEYLVSMKNKYYREHEIEQWFQKNYDCSIIDYMNSHKSLVEEVEKEVDCIIKRTKEKFGNEAI